MWEFFVGVSAACFFAVFFLKRGERKIVRPREAIYAPAEDVIRYTTHKKANDYAPAAPCSFNEAKADIPAIEIPETEIRAAEEGVLPSFENPAPAAEEKEGDDDKKAKFGALRFFDS